MKATIFFSYLETAEAGIEANILLREPVECGRRDVGYRKCRHAHQTQHSKCRLHHKDTSHIPRGNAVDNTHTQTVESGKEREKKGQ